MRKALRSLTFFMCSMFVLCLPRVALAQCTQTLSVGANIASAVASAPNGSTICLNSGNYGNVDFNNISRTGFVTLTSASGVGARMSPRPTGSSYIRFKSLTLTNGEVTACSTHIEFIGNTWVPDAAGALVNGTSCPSTPQYIVFDGDTFDRVQQKLGEGRLYLAGANTITIKNSVFSGNPSNGGLASDGIQMGSGTRNLTLGPGNYFRGIYQDASSGPHVDSIQCYNALGGTQQYPAEIVGNYFYDDTIFIGYYGGACGGLNIHDNVFDTGGTHTGGSNCQAIQMGGLTNVHFHHNTLRNFTCGTGIGTQSGQPINAQWIVENNIFDGANTDWNNSQNNGCGTDCIVRYNLKSNGATLYRDDGHNITGNAVYSGSLSYANWANWQLTLASPGHSAGNDGFDMGVLYYGVGAPPAPPPPPPPVNKFTIGQQVTTTQLANIRQTAAGALLGTQNAGAIGQVTAGPVDAVLNATTVTWWNVNFSSGADGWVGEDSLAASSVAKPSAPANLRIIR